MKVLIVLLVLFATALMAVVIYFVKDASVVDTIAAAFAISINGFLGVDVAAMIKASSSLPAGQYKSIHLYRYIIAFLCMALLFGLSLWQKENNGVQAIMAISAFGSGCMIIIGLIITGVEGNKIASRAGGIG